jgi:hypothetical protein
MTSVQIQKPVDLSERICEGCGKPVQRNLAIYDRAFFHVYCLKRTRARPDYFCMECFAYWSRGRLGTVLLDEGASKELVCPSCGAIGLVHLKRNREAQPA